MKTSITRVQIPNSTSPPENQGQEESSVSERQERGLVGWRIGSEGEWLVGRGWREWVDNWMEEWASGEGGRMSEWMDEYMNGQMCD